MREYKGRDELAYRQIEEQMVIVDPRGGILHTLNEVGCFAWNQMEQGNTTLAGLTEAVVREFEVSEGQARQDLETFLGELESKALLQAEGAGE